MEIVNQMYIEPRAGAAHLGLDGKWRFNWGDVLPQQPDGIEWKYEATLPASVFWNLHEAGVLPHPYEGCNSKLYNWVDGKVWYFQKRFLLDKAQDTGRAMLCFDGAAYYARVWVNGQLLGDHSGMFGGPVAEIYHLLHFGCENEITVAICAANHPAKPAYSLMDPGNQVIVPWNIVRDGHTSNGDFVVLGLWRGVRIEFLPPLHLSRPYLTTRNVEDGTAHLALEVELIQPEYDPFAYAREYEQDTYSYTFAYKNGMADALRQEDVQLRVEMREKTTGRLAFCESRDIPLLDYERVGVEPGFEEPNFVCFSFCLENARLWNPVGLGDPFCTMFAWC